jgi:hypothetical protein
VPAQPVEREAPPSGADWVHEIKHDGYRMLVRRDGDSVRLYSRNALDWTARLPAIAAGASLLKAKSFTIDGEAVVIGPNGLTDFEALRRRGAGEVAVLYAFDLLELDGDDLRNLPIETRKATLASLLRKPCALLLRTCVPPASDRSKQSGHQPVPLSAGRQRATSCPPCCCPFFRSVGTMAGQRTASKWGRQLEVEGRSELLRQGVGN